MVRPPRVGAVYELMKPVEEGDEWKHAEVDDQHVFYMKVRCLAHDEEQGLWTCVVMAVSEAGSEIHQPGQLIMAYFDEGQEIFKTYTPVIEDDPPGGLFS